MRLVRHMALGITLGWAGLVIGAGTASANPWLLSSSTYGGSFTTQPYIGNGYISARLPSAGTGFEGHEGIQTWPTYGERFTNYSVDGVYAREPSAFGDDEVLASVPAWSTMTFGTGGATFSASTPASEVSDYRQTLDLRTGTLSTRGTWSAPVENERVAFASSVTTDRANDYLALVTLSLTPRFTGSMTMTSILDGTGARRTLPVAASTDTVTHTAEVTVSTVSTGTQVAEVSVLKLGAGVRSTTDLPQTNLASQTAGEELTFPVTAGHTYRFVKYVAVVSSRDASNPATVAEHQAAAAAARGATAQERANAAAWARLWASSIELPRSPVLQQVVRAEQFYLWASVRGDGTAIVGPAGLSSDSYAGEVFWDADTWMFPALLAQHPKLAGDIEQYRYDTLAAARANAPLVGARGAFYPWEGGPIGTIQDDCYGTGVANGRAFETDDNSCTGEIHLQGDIALAQWQFYEATGNTGWLKSRGWPVLQGLAEYWASRATPDGHGRYTISHVEPPDEYEGDVTNEVFTNAVAANALRVATRAAHIVRASAPAAWDAIADGLDATIPFDGRTQMHPEYDGYDGATVKQADVVMLTYPLGFRMPRQVALNDLNYYAARTSPSGPAMTDAIHSIDTSQLGVTGCSAWTYALRAYQPYLRGPFDQFSETRPPDTTSAFDFLTGVGGFLQTFLYGFTGLRLEADAVHLSPSLPPQLPALTLPGVQWHGRAFTIDETQARTIVRLTRGARMSIVTPHGRRTLRIGRPLELVTRRTARAAHGDLALCRNASASSAVAGNPPIAAIDGSAATSWRATSPQATLTIPLGHIRRVRVVELVRAGSSAFAERVQTSLGGRVWTTVASGVLRGGTQRLHFAARRARYVRLAFPGGRNAPDPAIAEFQILG